MSFFQLLENSPSVFAKIGLVLAGITLFTFIFNKGFKFRLVGITIFTFILSLSSWAFLQSYTKPISVSGSIYSPIVFDNGTNLIVAQAKNDFPDSAIKPTLAQISANLKVGSRTGSLVKIRLRKLDKISPGISQPIVLGEITKDFSSGRINEGIEN